jgi:hypothetical protein
MMTDLTEEQQKELLQKRASILIQYDALMASNCSIFREFINQVNLEQLNTITSQFSLSEQEKMLANFKQSLYNDPTL